MHRTRTLVLFLLIVFSLVSLSAATKDYVLEAQNMKAFAAGAKADGETEMAGTDNFFTLHWSAKSKVDGSSKSWKDGYESAQRLNLQGGISVDGTPKNAISFTTTAPESTVKVWWVEGGDDKRQITVLDAKGGREYVSSEDLAKNGVGYTVFTLGPGLHYLGSTPGNNYIFKLSVSDSEGFVAEAPKEEPKKVLEVAAKEPAQPGYVEKYEGREWQFRAFGTSTNTSSNGIAGTLKGGSVTIFSEGGKGKIVPASTDGLAYFFTTIDPKTENFTLMGRIKVEGWTYSNGQEGFGIMIADTVGEHGSTDTVWNNSVMAMASKVEYRNEDNAKISMKLGIGALSRLGVTGKDAESFVKEGVFHYADGSTGALPEKFVSETTTLEESCAGIGAGTYNIIGAYTTEPDGTRRNQVVTEMVFSVRRNNNGYLVTYMKPDGTIVGEHLVYDDERNALTQIDPEHIYVGFFAARNAKITVSDITLTTIAPEADEKAKARTMTYVEPDYRIESGDNANSPDYTLVFVANADGLVTVRDESGKKLAEKVAVKADEKCRIPAKLQKGYNEFTVEFTPDKEFQFDQYTKLLSYNAAMLTKTVEYKTLNGTTLYVSPKGRSNGSGTKSSPLDIATALKFASKGQTILITEGTYKLTSSVRVERGIDGTPSEPVVLKRDPEAKTRPVFDFSGRSAGFVFGGDWWLISGFDVTNTQDGQKGIQLSGDHCTLEDVYAYRNGNTGIQISRLFGSDLFEDWPSHNTVKGCVSFLNADKGYEDADGFAAKLTIGDGNVFEDCIAAYNADDGWDLYAKVETGSIGQVVIRNCVAFRNGYVVSSDGKEIAAGNGNGFKMGGESLSGRHLLENSVAFLNKGKGIDSNSCPDIQVKLSTTFDNGSYNVAFYTNNAVNTDFSASGILSFRSTGKQAEQLKAKGSQSQDKIQNATNYYVTEDGTSRNANGGKAASYWFKSTESGSVINGFKVFMDTLDWKDSKVRLENGKVTLGDFLALSSSAPAGVGARL